MFNRNDYVSDKDWQRFLDFSKDLETPNIFRQLSTLSPPHFSFCRRIAISAIPNTSAFTCLDSKMYTLPPIVTGFFFEPQRSFQGTGSLL